MPIGCSGMLEHVLELGSCEEAHDLQGGVAGVVDRVGHELRHDRQRPCIERHTLTVNLCLARAVDDEEDLLGAVRVAPEVLAGLDFEVDDRRALRPGARVQRKRRTNAHRCVRVTPGFSQLQLTDVHHDLLFALQVVRP